MQGTVKWFNAAKGFGFITADGVSTDVFVHHEHIVMEGYKKLNDGQHVEFELVESPKGPIAHFVKPK
jgi:CspA family cold shock protein